MKTNEVIENLKIKGEPGLMHALACSEAQTLLAPFDSPTGPIVLWFAGEMEKKLALPKNRAKGNQENWRGDPPWSLVERLLDETVEVQQCFVSDSENITVTDLPKLIKECADVANFAMMIADQAQQALADSAVRAPRPDAQTRLRGDATAGDPVTGNAQRAPR